VRLFELPKTGLFFALSLCLGKVNLLILGRVIVNHPHMASRENKLCRISGKFQEMSQKKKKNPAFQQA